MGDTEEFGVDSGAAFIALGSNVGDRVGHLRYAVRRMTEHDEVHVQAVSGVYETKAHTRSDGATARPYLNAVVHIETALDPRSLLAFCMEVERERGRDRNDAERWAARTLDLDLLTFEDERVDEPGLTLPHPRLAERLFVLRPLADIAPDVDLPPPFDATVRELLRDCRDSARIRRTHYSITHQDDRHR